jgi:hypothetical protein
MCNACSCASCEGLSALRSGDEARRRSRIGVPAVIEPVGTRPAPRAPRPVHVALHALYRTCRAPANSGRSSVVRRFVNLPVCGLRLSACIDTVSAESSQTDAESGWTSNTLPPELRRSVDRYVAPDKRVHSQPISGLPALCCCCCHGSTAPAPSACMYNAFKCCTCNRSW